MKNNHKVLGIDIAYPSTQGSGCNVSRLIPMTLMIVFIAAIPSHPNLRATLAGYRQKKQSAMTNLVQNDDTLYINHRHNK